ncbi:hypothetical protein [Rhizobium sp. ICMP 5592]|uniref:hypothetical protein n=1 Tax=Rhizobium sp. ICMP 5592 TaxID=2292445 RepID=UPI00256FF065|nr:hypothetical protein [Rhizobium sp. ICMP 5592]
MKKEPVRASTLNTALAIAMLKNAFRRDDSTAIKNVRGSFFDGRAMQLQSFIYRYRQAGINREDYYYESTGISIQKYTPISNSSLHIPPLCEIRPGRDVDIGLTVSNPSQFGNDIGIKQAV